MAIDLEQLLAPAPGDAPAGPDLAYDDVRYQIEQAFESSISIDVSGEAVPETDTDWRQVIKLIEEQSALTKDVWLAVYLCRAGARSGSLETVQLGAEYLAGLFEQYWDSVHPQLEEYGFQGRKGPCDSLTRVGEFLGPLQRATVVEHPRLGRFSGLDFARFHKGAENEEGYGQFRAALADLPEEILLAAAQRLEQIATAFRRADAVLTANADGDTGTNFKPAYDVLAELRAAVLAFTSAPSALPAETDFDVSQASGEAEPAAGPRIAGRVETREDVIRAIDAIADYYRRKEPASPVPLVLQRAREWVTLDFLSVLEDIAPGGLDEAKSVLTTRPKQTDNNSGW